MYKFMNREEWLKVINRWVLDGSKLESFGDNPDGEWVVLRGKDGAREELYFFYDEATYDKFDEMQPYGESTQLRTARLIVDVSLDALPGAFHTPESAKGVVQALLSNTINHYNPKVSLGEQSSGVDIYLVWDKGADSWTQPKRITGVFASLESAREALPATIRDLTKRVSTDEEGNFLMEDYHYFSIERRRAN